MKEGLNQYSQAWLKFSNKDNVFNYVFMYVLHKENSTKWGKACTKWWRANSDSD